VVPPLPRPPSWIKGGLLLRGGEGTGKGRGWEGRGEEGKERRGKGRGKLRPPFSNSWISL